MKYLCELAIQINFADSVRTATTFLTLDWSQETAMLSFGDDLNRIENKGGKLKGRYIKNAIVNRSSDKSNVPRNLINLEKQ